MFLWQALQAVNTALLKVTFGCEDVGFFLLPVYDEALILK